MTQRETPRWLRGPGLWLGVLAAIAVAGALLARRGGGAGASALSASPEGLLGARTYLERLGTRVSLADGPVESFPDGDGDALILAFPASGIPAPAELEALDHGLAAGGTVIFAYSGRSKDLLENLAAEGLGLSMVPQRGQPPLDPVRWWAYAKAEWRLHPEEALGPVAREIVIRAPDRIPQAPGGAVVLYRGANCKPAIFTAVRGRGRLVVLPSDALSNARLGGAGNTDLLESLRAWTRGRVAFEESIHGLGSSKEAADPGSRHSLDLLLAELVLLYLLAAFGLGRRFGPSWEEPPEISGSASTFLFGLGALHRRLGHYTAASARLLEIAAKLDPRVVAPRSLRAAAQAGGETEFLELAKAVARSQRRWRFR